MKTPSRVASIRNIIKTPSTHLPPTPQDMDDAEFHDLLQRLSEKGFEALYEGDYKHPHGRGRGGGGGEGAKVNKGEEKILGWSRAYPRNGAARSRRGARTGRGGGRKEAGGTPAPCPL